ncbi:MAG: SAF domain-containing protein, partial [Planctomycetota bacterium]
MRPKSLILILIALGCGLIASIGISQVVERGGDSKPQIVTSPIYVAMAEINIAEEFGAKNIKLEEWPIDKIPDGAVTEASELEGMCPTTRLYPGEPILLFKIASRDELNTRSNRIKPGFRVMSVRVSLE